MIRTPSGPPGALGAASCRQGPPERGSGGGEPGAFEAREVHGICGLVHLDLGATLVAGRAEQLLEQGRAVGSKELKDYMEVLGYAEAARWVYEQGVAPDDRGHDGLLTVTEVRSIHTLAMAKVWDVAPHPSAYPDETPGSFRQHDIAQI